MKTHFQWQTPKLAMSRKAAKALKQTLRPALQRALPDLSIFAAILLLCLILWPGSDSILSFVVLFAILVALACYVLLPLQKLLQINLHLRRSNEPSVQVRLDDDRIFYLSRGKIGFYKYADIQSFWIAMERFDDGTSPVLQLRTFDGREAVFPLVDDLSVENLREFLQDRITATRNRSRQLSTRKHGAALKKHAMALMVFTGLCVLVFAILFISSQSELTAAYTDQLNLEQTADQPDTADLLALHAKSSNAFKGLAGFGLLFLLACVLMLWGDARYLRARLARLQAYLPDAALNQRQKAGDV